MPVYNQCLGTAWPGSGQCSTCGAEIGTGGNCLAMIEIPSDISRNVITEMYHPSPMWAQEFVELISNPEALQNFVTNMNNLDMGPKLPEEWAELFVKWMELNK